MIWLMNTGMFRERATSKRYERAITLVRRMGYDFYVQTADVSRPVAGKPSISLQVVNQGVAPFYLDWALELGALSTEGKVHHTWPVDWKLVGLLPGDPPRLWQTSVELGTLSADARIVAVRVVNLMSDGKSLGFAKADQNRHAQGWLSVGRITADP